MTKNDMQIPRTYGTKMWNLCTNFKACIYWCIAFRAPFLIYLVKQF